MGLTLEDRRALIHIARTAIASALEGKKLVPIKQGSDALQQRSGVFVTLKIGSELRGCIGYVEPLFPLAQATQDVAVKAAMEDPRFDSLSREEFEKIQIEISVLSPITELKDIDTIEIGNHGLVIELGNRRGLLLPQVAEEYGWDRKQFLSQTSIKAGLPSDAWKRKEAKLSSFSVEKFDESHVMKKTT